MNFTPKAIRQTLSSDKVTFEVAEAAYHALLQGAKQAKMVDSFIAAKATLSVLRMYIEMGNHKMALTIWKAPPKRLWTRQCLFSKTAKRR